MIRPLFFSFLLLLAFTTASAQIGKGHKFIGGSFFFNYDEDGTSQTVVYPQGTTQYYNINITSFNVSPEVGFFIGKRFALSVQPGYSRVAGTEVNSFYSATNAANNYSYTRGYHTDIIGLAINARYYWMMNDKFGIYPQLGISSNHVLNNFLVGSLNVGGGPNVVFFPTSKLGLNMGFGNINYNYNYQTQGMKFNMSLNNSFSFGVNYYWGGK